MTIINMPHQLYAGGLQARDIYPEVKKYFYKKNSDNTSGTDNTLHGRGRAVNQGITLQTEKESETGSDLMCHVFVLKMQWST